MWGWAPLTVLPDVGEHPPDFFLHLAFLTFTFWRSLLFQPQGHEQVDPPPRFLPSAFWGHGARASRGPKWHLAQQRGQVPPAGPRVRPSCHPAGVVLSGDSLILPWFWPAQRSLWRGPLPALGVAFVPPAKPKWIQGTKWNLLTFGINPLNVIIARACWGRLLQTNVAYSRINAVLELKHTCCNSYKHYDCRVGAAGRIGHVKRPPESVGYELKGWGRWGRALALTSFPFLARVCLRLICFGLCAYLIRHQRTGKNAGRHNVELAVLISVTVFGPGSDTTGGRKAEIKSRTASSVSLVCSWMSDGAAFIKSTCSLLLLPRPFEGSSEASAASQFKSFSLSETDSINRFLGDDRLPPMLRFEGPSDVFEWSAAFWQSEEVKSKRRRYKEQSHKLQGV